MEEIEHYITFGVDNRREMEEAESSTLGRLAYIYMQVDLERFKNVF